MDTLPLLPKFDAAGAAGTLELSDPLIARRIKAGTVGLFASSI